MAANRSGLPDGYILENYEIRKVLGAGGFGITYLAFDASLKRYFAIKEYCPHDLSSRDGYTIHPMSTAAGDDYERGLQDFIQEAQTLARFHHRNIVGVARIFEANNTAYMVLNFEEGKSLKEWLKDRPQPPGQVEMDQIAGPLLDALQVIHADHTLHRDIAPDNIYIRTDGSPVLLDFGSARQALHLRSRSVSAIVKAGYSPQEQYSTRAVNQGPWTDIYALAATLYRCVANEAPPEASDRTIDETYRSLKTFNLVNFRPTFLDAIDWALKLRPKERPQSIQAWRGPLLRSEKIPPEYLADAAVTVEAGQSKPRRWAIAAALTLLVGGAAGATALYYDSQLTSIMTDAENRVAQTRRDVDAAQRGSDETRAALEQAQADSASKIEAYQREIDQSNERSASLAGELEQARSRAAAATEADKRKFLTEMRDLEARIEDERGKARAIEDTEKARKLTLSTEIARLENDLQRELSTKEQALAEGEALRAQTRGPSIVFGGLELAPAGADGNHLVRSVAPGGIFGNRIRTSDIVSRVSRNGVVIDLAANKPTLLACDYLVAELGVTGTPLRVEARVPQTPLAGGAAQRIGQTGLTVLQVGSDPRFMLQAVEDGSAFQAAGLKAGDILTAVGEQRPTSYSDLEQILERSATIGGGGKVEFLRDCSASSTIVDFGLAKIGVEWGGLVFEGQAEAPPKLKSINPNELLSAAEMLPDDELHSIAVNEHFVAVPSMREARAVFERQKICGTVQLKFMRSHMMTTTVRLPGSRRLSGALATLPVLGIVGWELANGNGFEVSRIEAMNIDGHEPLDLQTGDIIKTIGKVGAGKIVSMTTDEQTDFLANGGRITLERACDLVEISVPAWISLEPSLDITLLSPMERSAIVSALFAMKFYKPMESPQDFIGDGLLLPPIESAIRAFKMSRGGSSVATLSRRDVDYLVPLGRVELPGDIERRLIGEMLSNDLAGKPEIYLKRVALFLQAEGYAGADTRAELRRYQTAQGQTDVDGYITTLDFAEQVMRRTVYLTGPPDYSDMNFDDWAFRKRGNTCYIYARPIEIEGWLFNFSLDRGDNDSPLILLGVDIGEKKSSMYLNFGGNVDYDLNSSVSFVNDKERRYSLERTGPDDFDPRSEGDGSSDEIPKTLKNSHWVEVVGTSTYGGPLRIRYSAKGFTEAFQYMARDCRAPRIRDWLQ